MKALAAVLIVIGIAMILFRGFNVQTEKKVVDVGPVEINKKEITGWADPLMQAPLPLVRVL